MDKKNIERLMEEEGITAPADDKGPIAIEELSKPGPMDTHTGQMERLGKLTDLALSLKDSDFKRIAALEKHTQALDRHTRALCCHVECMGWSAHNFIRQQQGKPIPYDEEVFLSSLIKWDLINKEGGPITNDNGNDSTRETTDDSPGHREGHLEGVEQTPQTVGDPQ